MTIPTIHHIHDIPFSSDPPIVRSCSFPSAYVVVNTISEDSHLHVWGDGKGSFPYAEGQEPPERLRASSSPEVLIQEMDEAGVGGALIVQVS